MTRHFVELSLATQIPLEQLAHMDPALRRTYEEVIQEWQQPSNTQRTFPD